MGFDIKTDRPRGMIWLVGADGKHARPLPNSAPSRSPRWSPDGTRLAYLAAGADGSTQLFVYWADSGATTAISNFSESPSALAWSPDGGWLAFTMPVAAERKPLKVDLPEAPKNAKWADPPKLIDRMVFRVDGEGYLPNVFSQLFIIDADGGAARQLTRGDFDHEGTPSFTRRRQERADRGQPARRCGLRAPGQRNLSRGPLGRFHSRAHRPARARSPPCGVARRQARRLSGIR